MFAGAVVSLDGLANDGVPDFNVSDDNVMPDVEGVLGGHGADVLTGNGLDNLFDGGPGADELTGLGGADVADYSSRTTPVTVDLDGEAGDDGESGEGDTVDNDVEDVWGGAAADRLTGNGEQNFLV